MRAVFDALILPDGITSPNAVKAIPIDRLHLPIHICLGRYEAATTEELHELITDLSHELDRRQNGTAKAA